MRAAMRKNRTDKEQQGSMTVEAALFVTIFLMTFLTIVSFGQMTMAQVVMQHAINDSAMQISQYSYILTKTGVNAAMAETAGQAKKIRSDANEVFGAISELSNAIDGVADGDITAADVQGLIDAASGSQGAMDIAVGYFKNPKGLLTGLLAMGKEHVEQRVATAILGHVTEGQVEAHFEAMTDDPDAWLKRIGIVGGLEGLDYSQSTYAAGGSKDIKIVVRFTVENQMFPMFSFGRRQMTLSASTRIW